MNKLIDVYPHLIEALQKKAQITSLEHLPQVVDSLPIIIAKSKQSGNAKTANTIANKGYFSCKDEYYYGVKLHLVGIKKERALPLPEIAYISPASTSDITVFKEDIACNYFNVPFMLIKLT
ncbi:MAG: hypothetical protein HQK51_11805 [Oligoflexia bacterium]|nr:hypothetical protein [Oligoflexia bacterium]